MSVAIIGAGPVALSLALFLRDLSRKNAVFTPQVFGFAAAQPLSNSFHPRVVAVSGESVALLRELKVWDALDLGRVQPVNTMRVWSSPRHAPLDIDALTQHLPSLATIVEHQNLTQALHRVCEAQKVAFSAPGVRTLDSNAHEVRIDGERFDACLVADAKQRACVAPLAESVRTYDYAHEALVCIVRVQGGLRGLAVQVFAPQPQPDSVIALLPLPGEYATLVWSQPRAAAQARLSVPAAALAQDIAQAFPVPFDAVTVEGERQSVPITLSQATRWIEGRTALIGDAAHTVHPLAGQGLNLGLADVGALAQLWRRSADPGHPLVLHQYARMRAGATAQTQWTTDALWRTVAGTWAPLTPVRHLALAAAQIVPGTLAMFARQAGARA